MGQPLLADDIRLFRADGAARYLGVSIGTVYRLVRRGEITAVGLPGLQGLRFDRAELDALIERSRESRTTV